MNHLTQHQIEDILIWLTNNTACEWRDCDESQHVYFTDHHLNDHYIGGYAGDDGSFFLIPSPTQEALLNLYRAESAPEGDTEISLGLKGIVV